MRPFVECFLRIFPFLSRVDKQLFLLWSYIDYVLCTVILLCWHFCLLRIMSEVNSQDQVPLWICLTHFSFPLIRIQFFFSATGYIHDQTWTLSILDMGWLKMSKGCTYLSIHVLKWMRVGVCVCGDNWLGYSYELSVCICILLILVHRNSNLFLLYGNK